MPISTPAPTPTKPAPMPPAIVSDVKESSAEMFTAPSALEIEPPSYASVLTVSSVTPTGTATPTKPAPTAITRPKTFSLEKAWTATP